MARPPMTATDRRDYRHAVTATSVTVTLVIAIAALATASSTSSTGGLAAAGGRLAPGVIEVLSEDGVPEEVLVSRALLASSSSAVVVRAEAPARDRQQALALGRNRRVPVFVVNPRQIGVVGAELRRLNARTVVAVGGEVRGLRQAQSRTAASIGPGVRPTPGRPVVLVTRSPAAATVAAIAGADVVDVPVADPRATGASVAAVKRPDNPAIIAVGPDFGETAQLIARVGEARTEPELPGGGQLVFPGRRVVALYGSPGSQALGPLGRQNLPATIKLAQQTAQQYTAVSAEPVVPGFEIIVTVAAAEPGYRGAYTNVIEPALIEPWVDAAADAGIYVTLDLQPGRMDFLTQAQMYQGLLERPNVGLALDPEWRLKSDQVHLKQIGSVAPEEVNRTAAWLAALVRKKNLPQKAFVLHQFDADMLGDRTKLDTSLPELAFVLHADGHGTPSVKMGTWNRMTTGLPPNIWMGWKNFYREDKPMFTPKQTMAVRPVPYFISYQ